MNPLATYAAARAGRAAARRVWMIVGVAAFLLLPLSVVLIGSMVASTGGDRAGAGASGLISCRGVAVAKGGAVTLAIDGIPITPEQVSNAATIAAVGAKMNVPPRGQIIAIATATQESRLINRDNGDRDSVGLFQQRPSQGWGSIAQIMDPVYSATKFYDGLLKVAGWDKMALTDAAQAVQRSGFPFAYAQWEGLATALTGGVSGIQCTAAAVGTSPSAIVNAATKWIGMPYVWGGGGISGASGIDQYDGRGPGFDCSGLVQFAVYAGSGSRLTLPRLADDQIFDPHGQVVGTGPRDLGRMQAGDIIGFSHGGGARGSFEHIGIYMGDGKMVHAPQSGENVKIGDLSDSYWQGQTWRVVRFG